MDISFENVGFSYPRGPLVIQGLNLLIPSEERVALLGPSGSGKTTLLRLLAGLERPDEGKVLLGTRLAIEIEPKSRSIGYVPQEEGTYPALSVLENVLLPVRARAGSRDPFLQGRAEEMLELFGLKGLANRPASKLSGGERQRLAMAKALGWSPTVLAMDEPLSAVDAQSKPAILQALIDAHEAQPYTAVLVTHNANDAFRFARVLVVLERGRVVQVGSVRSCLTEPASRTVMSLLAQGQVNWFPLAVSQKTGERSYRAVSQTAGIEGCLLSTTELSIGQEVVVGVLPWNFSEGRQFRGWSIQCTESWPAPPGYSARCRLPSGFPIEVRSIAPLTNTNPTELGLSATSLPVFASDGNRIAVASALSIV